MNRIMIAAAASLAGLAGSALAQELADTDGNGTFSLEELTAAYPDLTAETFALIDANGDGVVDQDELTAAQEAGTLAD
jgi:cytochrome oxidase Cu insertion factor (SCO1/SenC/PrrC family)